MGSLFIVSRTENRRPKSPEPRLEAFIVTDTIHTAESKQSSHPRRTHSAGRLHKQTGWNTLGYGLNAAGYSLSKALPPTSVHSRPPHNDFSPQIKCYMCIYVCLSCLHSRPNNSAPFPLLLINARTKNNKLHAPLLMIYKRRCDFFASTEIWIIDSNHTESLE